MWWGNDIHADLRIRLCEVGPSILDTQTRSFASIFKLIYQSVVVYDTSFGIQHATSCRTIYVADDGK